MANKLRIYAGLVGAGLVGLSLWATGSYGDRPGARGTFVLVAAVGVGIAVTPVALAYAKLALERWRHRGRGGVTYTSAPIDVDRATFVRDTAAAFSARSDVVGVRTTRFPEGRGLLVDHTAFHGTFVRLSSAGRLVVTGVTREATADVAAALEEAWSTSLRPTASNPLVRPIPVRGAPRVLLAVVITVLVVGAVLSLAGAAYPAAAYNPGERAVLVGIDLHTDLDPSVSRTDGRLTKARFLVSVIREEAVEIRWAANRSAGRPPPDGAGVVAAEVERLLDRASAGEPTAAQRARIRSIRRDLAEALRAVRLARAQVDDATGPPTPAAP